MAAADAPAGLMDIASTLTPAEIPFKLRCAICSKLALNAFRLPCCDQSICESCQASLHDTCPVCAHTPVSADLCKPNKALRTTLKAFLRTEEKKRERDRQATVPPTPDTPADSVAAPQETPTETKGTEPAPVSPSPGATQFGEPGSDETPADAPLAGTTAEIKAKTEPEPADQPELAADQPTTAVQNADAANTAQSNSVPAEAEAPIPRDESAVAGAQGFPQQQNLQFMSQNMGSGGFPGMGWHGSANFGAMNPYMANGMFNFPNAMGMPMAMDPMAANQGMFGDYEMNMTGMMNMGVNYNGQGMYGSLGWDGSQQNNMWHGGQDKFNPNAFANGTGSPYGAAFGGSNTSPYPSNPNFQAGYHGHGRGGFRGRGRGHFASAGRGGFGGSGPYMQSAHSPAFPHQFSPNGTAPGGDDGPHAGPVSGENAAAEGAEDGQEGAAATEGPQGDQTDQQLRGIPTIDSFDQPAPMNPGAYANPMGSGYGRGGYMRGPGRGGFNGGPMPGPYQPTNAPMEPRGVGVEGAPAAPRAMRQGLPNTSVFRQRGFQVQGLAGSHSRGQSQANSEAPRDVVQSQSPVNAPSKPAGSRSQSPSQSQAPRSDPPTAHDRDDGRDSERERNPEHSGRTDQDQPSRSRSPKPSRRSSRRRHHESDGDGKSSRRHHSRRHRSRTGSRSRSPSRNGDSRPADRLAQIAEESKTNGRSKPSSEKGGRDLASRISTGMRSRHREEERESGRDRERRRRDRKRDRDRDTEGERRRDPDREKDRARESDRERPRERDRKRSRRDRSESANANAQPSREHARRTKRNRADDGQAQDRLNGPAEPEKDPHTLEREARNRERLLREQQRRESAKSGRRDSRPDRVVAGRRINYKYEDELDH
ncbi:uncharacterized protein PFLUO_LOCUS2257 [Penicillium psychrofluorescens]|uniref:uncharacterized protein n=1 Tax=Penicillium psychrofluorescens TaxID=3158075 RepID=UPI003CCE07D4